MYEKALKRCFDFLLSLIALLVLSPFLLIFTLIGAIVMRGNPFFTQPRPGKNERIFRLVKFRSMTNRRDKDGRLLPDEERLTAYGRFIRSTSIDELPSLFNIVKGDLSIVGPRPQLVRDMVFMSEEERKRHTVSPGLTGLAQCSGRNNMSWERKLQYDLQYIERITLFGDIRIILKTAWKVLKRDGINEEGMATAEDLGDYLLRTGRVTVEEYERKQEEARKLLLREKL